MDIIKFIEAVIAWHVLGIVLISVAVMCDWAKSVTSADGIEFVDPVFVHACGHSWSQAVVSSACYSILLPVPTVCYWIYRLCAIRRKK